MGDTELSAIEMSLASLRLRIRRLQCGRGVMSVVLMILVALILIMGSDWLVGPLSASWRWFLWGFSLILAIWVFWRSLVKPLTQPLSLLQIARWLETRHPELEEGISTALQFASDARGVSSELIQELCATASIRLQDFRPKQEVSSHSLKKVLIPALSLAGLLALFLIIWPGQVSRLLLRSAAPFVTVGNAGAVYFTCHPGDVEVLEGDGFLLELSFRGDLSEGFSLMTDSGVEQLNPESSNGDLHHFRYRFSELRKSFSYRAKVGSHESDQYQVQVYPRPRFRQVEVLAVSPPYTGIPEKQFQLGTSFSALAGSTIHFKGSLNTPALGAKKTQGDNVQILKMIGNEINWQSHLELDDPPQSKLILTPRLGDPYEALSYTVEILEDRVPEIELKSPRDSQLRIRRDDHLQIDYEVIEYFGLSGIEIEFASHDDSLHSDSYPLPVRMAGAEEGLWVGKIDLDFASLDKRFLKLSQLKIRLVVSDNRPSEYQGPGRAYSDWIEIIFDETAPSLVRQKLKSEQADFQKTLEKAQRDLRKARQEMDRVRPNLRRPTLVKEALQAMAASSKKMVAAEEALEELLDQLPNTVQAHRSDEIRVASRTIIQARLSLQDTPLQDTPESRNSELTAASRDAELAHQQLQKIRDAAHQDQYQVNQLASLEELAQRQERLSQKNASAPEWQQEQGAVRDATRKLLRQSPSAMAKALQHLSEQADQLAAQSTEVSQRQKDLAKDPSTASLRNQLKIQQQSLARKLSQSLAQARTDQREEANLLADAEAKAHAAASNLNPETAQDSQEVLAEIPSQEPLAKRQQMIAQSIAAVEKEELTKALQILQQIQAQDAADLATAIAQVPSPEQGMNLLKHAKSRSQSGKRNTENAVQRELEKKRNQAAKQNQKASQQFQDGAMSLQELGRQAKEKAKHLSAQQEPENQLSLPAEPVADAFQEGSQALTASDPASAQKHATRAAKALKQVARKAREALSKGRRIDQMPPSENGEASHIGDGLAGGDSSKSPLSPQQAQLDQGVPPQLSQLGISADDWDKMKEQLKSGVGMVGEGTIPDDYRALTQQYFQELSQDR